jgi:hypothetical protein
MAIGRLSQNTASQINRYRRLLLAYDTSVAGQQHVDNRRNQSIIDSVVEKNEGKNVSKVDYTVFCSDVADAFDNGWSPEDVATVFKLPLKDVLSFYEDYIDAYMVHVAADADIQRGFDNFRD